MTVSTQKILLQDFKSKVKIGDVIGFYHTKWYYIFTRLIRLGMRAKIEHVAIITHILKINYDNEVHLGITEFVAFDFSKIRFWRGKIVNRVLIIDNKLLQNVILYYLENKNNTNIKHLYKVIEQIKIKKPFYSWYMALISPKNERILYLEKGLNNFTIQRAFICSQYIVTILKNLNQLKDNDIKDLYLDPAEITKLSIFTCYEITI